MDHRRATGSARERLLAAASVAFARLGYEQAGVHAICAEAAATTGALYHHFGSKAGLFTAVRDRLDETVLAAMRRAAEALPPGPKAVRAALLAAWDEVQAKELAALLAQANASPLADPLPPFVQSLWPWAPAALGHVLVAAWRGAVADAARHPDGNARQVLDGILRGLGADVR